MTAEMQNVTSNMDDEETTKAPIGLVILVVALGVAIIGMLGLMAFKIMSGDASKQKKQTAAVEMSTVPAASFDELKVSKPADSTLSKIETNDNSVILHYRGEDKVTLIVIDRVTGKESRIIVAE